MADPTRREQLQRSTEHYGQGQSGFAAGFGDHGPSFRARNQAYREDTLEDRDDGMATDDRFTGRGGQHWHDDGRGDIGGDIGDRRWRQQQDQQRTAHREPMRRAPVPRPMQSPTHSSARRYDERDWNNAPQAGLEHAGLAWQPARIRAAVIAPEDGGGHRGKGPQSYTRPDQRIAEDVNEALTDAPHVDASHIEVVVQNGEVILTGFVEDRRTKRAAEDVALEIRGVHDVHNQLRIQSPSGDHASAPGPGNRDEPGRVSTYETDDIGPGPDEEGTKRRA